MTTEPLGRLLHAAGASDFGSGQRSSTVRSRPAGCAARSCGTRPRTGLEGFWPVDHPNVCATEGQTPAGRPLPLRGVSGSADVDLLLAEAVVAGGAARGV